MGKVTGWATSISVGYVADAVPWVEDVKMCEIMYVSGLFRAF